MIGPIVLLMFFELQFLPYHDPVVTWWHRIAVLLDLALLGIVWPWIVVRLGSGGPNSPTSVGVA